MAAFETEHVLAVRHWNEHLFSFTTTRDSGLRFENGQFLMIGVPVDGRPLMRAYSIASANYEEHLEFFSIKVPGGPLTSRLQHLREGDELLVSRKPTGTLLLHDLRPGRNLYLLSTGTGLAPFLAIARDPETYERFDRVILAHGVRQVADLAYREYLQHELPQHEYLGEFVQKKLLYYPAVTREHFTHCGRLDTLLASGQMIADLALPPLDPRLDRAMLCGSPGMLKSLAGLLDGRGFAVSPRIGVPGDYVIERAFVER
ncbi:MAG: ferredoxin--NADP reductase [Tahibacter sp.]